MKAAHIDAARGGERRQPLAGSALLYRRVRPRCRLSKRGQCELKRAARPGIARGPYAAVMLLDDRPADRQSDAQAVRLRREEGVEQPVDIFWLDTDAGILDRNKHLIGPVLARSNQKFATAVGHGSHGLDAVHQKIHYGLLQLNSVAINRRERRPEAEPKRDAGIG